MIKQRTFFFFILIVIVTATGFFQSCGPSSRSAPPPRTEPSTPEPMERFPEKETPATETTEEKKTEENNENDNTTGETITLQKEEIKEKELTEQTAPLKPIKNETIPLITPQAKPADVNPLKKTINTGITKIIREFGYSGNIEVPDNFRKKVAHYIRYFTADPKGSRFYLRAMGRGSQYLPMIRKVLESKRLPLSLAYLPVIESGFNPHSRSRAGAVGMWQFMKGTARMYGLKVYRRTDERRNPIKSTKAAAEYLNDLLAMFGAEDPFLGICAYNAGEGKILRALRKISYKERSFWTLVKKNLLRNETDEYIPQFIAVIIMGNNPSQYTTLAAAQPAEPTHPTTPADNDANDREIIQSLHAEKVELFSPEDEKNLENGNHEPQKTAPPPKPKKKKGPTYHKIRKGETLYRIAKNYNVSVRQLKKWNRLRGNRIRIGKRLVIYSPTSQKYKKNTRKRSKGYKLIYTVNYTDSLARIALFFKGVSVKKIMKWNRLRRTRIHPKQKLTLYLAQRPRKILTHKVRRGETAAKIARKYKQRLEYILSLNNLLTNSKLRPGQRIKIYYF